MAETNRTLGALLDLYVIGNITGEIGAQDGRDGFVTVLSGSWQSSVIDKDLTAPPGAPTVGDRYVVGPAATGAWSTHDYEIAEWLGAAWHFWLMSEGMAVYIVDEAAWYYHEDGVGVGWVPMLAVDEAESTLVTGSDTTASATYVLIASTQMTVVLGRLYSIRFSGSVLHSAASGTIDLAIYVNGVQVASSVRHFVRAASTITVPFCCEALETVVAGDVIDCRWKTSGATATILERSLIVQGVRNG